LRVAIVGGGISGLVAAHRLTQLSHATTLYEANAYLGGHTNTVDVTLDGKTFGVDTGFLVYNDRTYPRLIALFASLGVEAALSDMSFAVRNDATGLEWSGTSFSSLFTQPSNAFKPRFLRMLADILRFNRTVTGMVQRNTLPNESLGSYLQAHAYGPGLVDDYLLPMAACIWSAPKAQILAFPLSTFAHFFNNHGLLAIRNRPQWRTVRGGAREYVRKIAAGLPDVRLAAPVRTVRRSAKMIEIETEHGRDTYDYLVLASHSDQALKMLDAPDADERRALSAIRYQSNRAVLHTDASLMPTRRKAWSAWNYLALDAASSASGAAVSLTYWMNTLQPLPFTTDVFVTLNPARPPKPSTVLGEYDYAHPLFDEEAIVAQGAIGRMQGRNRTFYAGAWLGYGFHEDGLVSGENAAALVHAQSSAT
jgi:uncharacterized protein